MPKQRHREVNALCQSDYLPFRKRSQDLNLGSQTINLYVIPSLLLVVICLPPVPNWAFGSKYDVYSHPHNSNPMLVLHRQTLVYKWMVGVIVSSYMSSNYVYCRRVCISSVLCTVWVHTGYKHVTAALRRPEVFENHINLKELSTEPKVP